MNAYWCRWMEKSDAAPFSSQGPNDELITWTSGWAGNETVCVGLVWAKSALDAQKIIERRCPVTCWSFVKDAISYPTEDGRFPTKSEETLNVWRKRWPAGFAALPTGEEVDRG